MKKVILLIVVVAGMRIQAQQDAMFTHYMYNTLWLNPAYAGTRDALTVTGIHRSQWVGFDGAPLDQTITAHMPFYKGKMGAGLSIMNDRIGPTKSTIIAGDYAYQIKINSKSKLGLGLKALMNIYNTGVTSLKIDEQNDAAFASNYQRVIPNAGFGAYYYRERFYAGISTPKLIESKLNKSSNGSVEQRHYFFITGAVFKLTNDIKLKPTAFIKATKAAPIEAEFTANVIIQDKYTAGLMYRTGDAFGLLLGYQINDQFTVGYSFDWSMANTTGKYNAGSHELMLRFDLFSIAKAKIKSPRYF